MISVKSDNEIELLKKAGNIVFKTHQHLKEYIKPGITTKELDNLAFEFIISLGAIPSFKGYNNFPSSICTSLNQVVVHGIPDNTVLKNGDIISIDVGAQYKGYHGDSAWSYEVGSVTKDKNYLLEHTKKALFIGLEQIKPGNRIGDISFAIGNYAKKHKLGIVKELVGHGVGTNLHEDPEIPNYGKAGTGSIIKKGMVLAIEPMLTLGSPEIIMLDDGWTIETEDYSPSGHFEHTIVVTDNGYEILTGDID